MFKYQIEEEIEHPESQVFITSGEELNEMQIYLIALKEIIGSD